MSTEDAVGRVIADIRRQVTADTVRTIAEWGLVSRSALARHVSLDDAVADTREELRRIADSFEKGPRT